MDSVVPRKKEANPIDAKMKIPVLNPDVLSVQKK